ncbi:MAG: hypothetical protein A2W33_08040 [Chloroflexi bacterium RBG_16_52_11]|nr:MAG: hypothetical protein A2W33_08040 [Chloroflexi bacterium RBG_16_52_11]
MYSFVDYSLTKVARWSADKFDLQRMEDLLARLGHPERDYPIIHIAGTKGKGSVSAFCASALCAAGYRTGLYTSPHLHDYTERIRVNGKTIPQAVMVEMVEEVRPVIESIRELTTFEITTALAFLYFSRQNVEAAVVEVGLGGRLDATNIITPVISVITSLSYDHMFILGNTLEEIAGEKAGIIKPGIPLVLAPQSAGARQVIEKIAVERSAPLIQVGEDIKFTIQTRSLQGTSLTVWREASTHSKAETGNLISNIPAERAQLRIPLLGEHQAENASVAYTALELFSHNGLSLSLQSIQEGFSKTQWPGRFEVLSLQPIVVIDCAHNRDSALKLRLTMEAYFPGKPVILVFGASEDKDIEGMFAELLTLAEKVILTQSTHPRAANPEQLAGIASRYGKPVRITPDIADAVNDALQDMDDEHVLLITGSIFIVAGAREAWMARSGVLPEWA